MLAAGLSATVAQPTSTPLTPGGSITNATPPTNDPAAMNRPQRKDAAMKGTEGSGLMHQRESAAAYADAKRACNSMGSEAKNDCMKRARDDRRRSMHANKRSGMNKNAMDNAMSGTATPDGQRDMTRNGGDRR